MRYQFPVETVRMPAELDAGSALGAGTELWAAVASGAGMVVADMTGTKFCDPAGLAALVAVHRGAQARGTQLRVAAASAEVRRVLAAGMLDSILTVYPSLSAALTDNDPAG